MGLGYRAADQRGFLRGWGGVIAVIGDAYARANAVFWWRLLGVVGYPGGAAFAID